MKNKILFTLLALAGGSLLAADSGPKEDLIAAAKKMVQEGYSWRTTLEMGNFSNVSDGKVEKDGLVQLTLTFNDSTTQVFLKDKKGAVKLPDQEWQSLEELTSPDNTQRRAGRFMGRFLRDYKAPAAQVADLFEKIKELKQDGDIYSGDLTEAGAKSLLTMGGGRRGGNAPEVSNAKGSVRIALRDGLVSKFELRLQGTMTINGQDREINSTITVEVRDVGKTTLEVPAAAKEKLS